MHSCAQADDSSFWVAVIWLGVESIGRRPLSRAAFVLQWKGIVAGMSSGWKKACTGLYIFSYDGVEWENEVRGWYSINLMVTAEHGLLLSRVIVESMVDGGEC